MRNPQPKLWTVNEDGKIVPVGHDAPVEQPGDITVNPLTDSVYRNVIGQVGKLHWLFIGRMSEMGIAL